MDLVGLPPGTKEKVPALLRIDSAFVVTGVNDYLSNWLNMGWKRYNGKRLNNLEE